MANWMIYAANAFGKPVWEQMKAALLGSSVIHADETVVQVLNEPGKKAKTDSRMWVYCNGKLGEHSNILFEYQPTRNGEHAVRFLGDYRGYLVCDGYDGYNKLKNAVRCGCFAHCPRAHGMGAEFCGRTTSGPETAIHFPGGKRGGILQSDLWPGTPVCRVPS